MAGFVIPDHGDTRFFSGSDGKSGAERIDIQQGATVLLEQSGDAGRPGVMPSLYSSAEAVASISGFSTSGKDRQRFTLTAKSNGTAILNGKDPAGKDCVFPLEVRVGNYDHHPNMTIDLFADHLGKSNDAFKIYTAQRILMGNDAADNTNIFDQQCPYNANRYSKDGKPNRYACGSVVQDRGQELFGKDNVSWLRLVYYNPLPQRSLTRNDFTYDPKKMFRARTLIRDLLQKGKPVRVGCLHHPNAQNGPVIQPDKEGGHFVLIVGCNDRTDRFLYLDPWFGGSKLVYRGGIGRSSATKECFYMGLLKSEPDNAPRGPVLRQDDSTFRSFGGDAFLEVTNGPL